MPDNTQEDDCSENLGPGVRMTQEDSLTHCYGGEKKQTLFLNHWDFEIV